MFDISQGQAVAQIVAIVWSVLWSFAMEYLWFFSAWVEKLDAKKKQSVNALGVFLVVAGMYALSMFNVFDIYGHDAAGLLDAFVSFFVALGIGQGVHVGTKSLFS